MIKKFLNLKGKQGLIALSLLSAAPLGFMPIIKATYEASTQEEALFTSLRKFLFRTRSTTLLNQKKWADWCNEWVEILDTFPANLKSQYASLKTDLSKVSRWKNAISIGSKLEKALRPYLNKIPEDIKQRILELDKENMLKLISASIQGVSPDVPDSNIESEEALASIFEEESINEA